MLEEGLVGLAEVVEVGEGLPAEVSRSGTPSAADLCPGASAASLPEIGLRIRCLLFMELLTLVNEGLQLRADVGLLGAIESEPRDARAVERVEHAVVPDQTVVVERIGDEKDRGWKGELSQNRPA